MNTRATKYLECLENYNPSMASKYDFLLPTQLKPNHGTPYVWLIGNCEKTLLITTLKAKPVFMELDYSKLNDVKVQGGTLCVMFDDYENYPDIRLPVSVDNMGEAKNIAKTIGQYITKAHI